MTGSALADMTRGYIVADLVFVLVAIAIWLLLRKAVFSRLGYPQPATLRHNAALKFLAGWGWALAALVMTVLPIWALGGFSSGPAYSTYKTSVFLSGDSATEIWLFFCVQSLAEELVFRMIGMGLLGILLFWLAGWLLKPGRLAGDSESPSAVRWLRLNWLVCGLAANIIVSCAFASVHMNNPSITPLALANIVLAGLVLGQLFWMQGQPLGAWALHWVWNAGQASLGLPVSGHLVSQPLFYSMGFSGARDGILSGGQFGLEGSITSTLSLSLILLAMLWQHYRGIAAAASPSGVGSASAADNALPESR